MKNSTLVISLILSCLLFSGCDNRDGPIERTGENIDKAIQDTGDAIEDAGDEIEDVLDGK